MADLVRIIEQNECLREYFKEFPKQLMRLLCEKEVGQISSSSDVLVNFNLLQSFLSSDKSPFEVNTVQDFVETLDILGFSRGSFPERRDSRHTIFRFFNSNFKRGQPVPDDLYKRKTDKSQHAVKNAKRMLDTHCITFFQSLLEKHNAPPLEITKLDLARMKLQFALENQLDSLAKSSSVIEYSVAEPNYVRSKEIAGYYGDVPMNALKFAFQNYFPIYNPILDQPEPEPEEVPPQADLVWEMPLQAPPPPPPADQIVPVKKFPKFLKQCRDESRENEQALAFLHQESMALQLTEE